jgi:hypothetical protein
MANISSCTLCVGACTQPSPAQPSTDIRAIVVISIVMIYRVGKEIDQQLGRQDPQAANIMIMAMMS